MAVEFIIATHVFLRQTQFSHTDADLLICLPGTFSQTEGLGPCSTCSKCPASVPTATSCSATRDTQCECDSGFFFLSTYSLCAPCSRCKRGEGAIQKCSLEGDTVCQICGPGTFSEEHLSTKPCQNCTQCSDSEVEIRPCMPNSDTLCMGECCRKFKTLFYETTDPIISVAAFSVNTFRDK